MPSVSPTGETVIDEIVGAITARLVLCDTPSKLADMVVVPEDIALASPLALMAVIAGLEELQLTRLVMSALLPSL